MGAGKTVKIPSGVVELIGGAEEVVSLLDWILGYVSVNGCTKVLSSGALILSGPKNAPYTSVTIPNDLIRQIERLNKDSNGIAEAIPILLLVGAIMGGKE